MYKISLACFILGLFAVITRSPLIFAPNKTLMLTRKFSAKNSRIRLLGLFVLFCAVIILFIAWNSGHIIGNIIFGFGLVLAIVSMVLFLIFPFIYRLAVEYASSLDPSVLRFLGGVGTTIGILLIYAGFALLPN